MEEETIGPYTKSPVHNNTKCIIFSCIMIALYWFLPADKNIYLLPLIFIYSYVAMGWYDQVYKCDTRLFIGSNIGMGSILDSIFKPQKIKVSDISKEEVKKLLPKEEQQKIYLRNVYLFHFLIIFPLLTYIGYQGKNTNPKAYGALLGVGILAGIYHGGRLINPRI